MPYRVIQWATGNVGKLAIEGVEAHPELELVGVWVHSAGKAGQRFGGVTATND
ncbi:MAG: dihydrodipicolinate reductase, partial [Acidimicrobiia bacterium]|nr:dihydrodipicolinate reductase [Acidimicrobiia bacterium]